MNDLEIVNNSIFKMIGAIEILLLIVGGIALIYLLIKKIAKENKEDFEKRDF